MMRKIILLSITFLLVSSLHLENLHLFLEALQQHHSLPEIHDAVDYAAVRQNYLSKLPQGPTVDGGKAYQIRDFFISDMGKVILQYFESLFKAPGLNMYQLSDQNYRLWLAIKMLSRGDSNVYARSLAADKNLFVEFVQRVYNIQ